MKGFLPELTPAQAAFFTDLFAVILFITTVVPMVVMFVWILRKARK